MPSVRPSGPLITRADVLYYQLLLETTKRLLTVLCGSDEVSIHLLQQLVGAMLLQVLVELKRYTNLQETSQYITSSKAIAECYNADNRHHRYIASPITDTTGT